MSWEKSCIHKVSNADSPSAMLKRCPWSYPTINTPNSITPSKMPTAIFDTLGTSTVMYLLTDATFSDGGVVVYKVSAGLSNSAICRSFLYRENRINVQCLYLQLVSYRCTCSSVPLKRLQRSMLQAGRFHLM